MVAAATTTTTATARHVPDSQRRPHESQMTAFPQMRSNCKALGKCMMSLSSPPSGHPPPTHPPGLPPGIYLIHNGNLTNTDELRSLLNSSRSFFNRHLRTESDSEVRRPGGVAAGRRAAAGGGLGGNVHGRGPGRRRAGAGLWEGRGLGTHLMRGVDQMARAAGLATAWVWWSGQGAEGAREVRPGLAAQDGWPGQRQRDLEAPPGRLPGGGEVQVAAGASRGSPSLPSLTRLRCGALVLRDPPPSPPPALLLLPAPPPPAPAPGSRLLLLPAPAAPGSWCCCSWRLPRCC